MYTNSRGQTIILGNELGKGGAATVYTHGTDKSKAVKIFKPDFLTKELTIGKRLEQLNKLSNVAQLEINFGQSQKAIGSWPREIVKDRNGRIVGFTMDTVNNGIDLTQVIFARDVNSAFYKYRNKPQYNLWINTFLYHPNSIRNRFVLSYYLSIYFACQQMV
jgi:DNA-binding helix-hairpin-helix protein with protein kinase domain